MRHAEWRRSPDDPKNVLELLARWPIEIIETQPRYEPFEALFGCWIIFAVLFAMIGLPVIGASLAFLSWGWFLGLATLVGTIAFEIVFARVWSLVAEAVKPKRPNTLAGLATLPATEATYPARVSIRYRGVLTGTDVAIVSFTGAWLSVEGSRMSCSLVSGDGRGVWRKGQLWIDLPYGGSLALRRVVNADFPVCWVRGPRSLWRDFEDDAKDWSHHAPPTGGLSVFPPLETHPTMRRGWKGFTAVSLGLMSLSLFLLAAGPERRVLLVLLFLGGWGAARGIVVRWRQGVADRRAQMADRHRTPGWAKL